MNFLARLFGGRKCKKLVKWQGKTLELGVEAGGGVFSVSNLKIDQKQLYAVSQLADTLDHHQFQMCLDYQYVPVETDQYRNYLRRRDEIRDAITLLRSTLIAQEGYPGGQKSALDSAIKNMQKVLGYTKLEGGNYNEAKPIFDEVLKRGPQDAIVDTKNADLLQFYEKLSDYLEITDRIFYNQSIVRDQLEELLKKRFDISRYQYEFMFEQFHNEMNEQELNRFKFIRQITQDLAGYNYDMFRLLEDNKAKLNDGPKLKDLHQHLEFWLAKYRAQIDNPHMALVYTGVPKELGGDGIPFPRRIEDFVSNRIKELRQLQ